MMRLDHDGFSFQEVMTELTSHYDEDIHFAEGRIIGSMCTSPESIAREAYMLFIEANLGNPGLCPGTIKLERNVIEMLLDLLGLDSTSPENQYAGGQMISGGTEANITALWLSRNLTGRRELILPESGHFSLFKAADLLGMKPVIVPLDKEYRMDVEKLQECVSRETAAIVGVAGTTELGQVDPIEEIGEIAVDGKIPFHVDAAFGGFVLPFLDGFTEVFDFRSAGVTSMGVDPHKMGLATIPSGALLLRDQRMQEVISVKSPYLTSEMNTSLSGTRNSASVAATFAVMRHLGRNGYRNVAEKCMENTRYLAERLRNLGIQPVMEPKINVLAAHTRHPERIVGEMKERGWYISKATHPRSIRFVVMPHITLEHIDSLITDLEEVIS